MKNQLRSHHRVKKWLNSVSYNRQIPLFRRFLPRTDRLANFFQVPDSLSFTIGKVQPPFTRGVSRLK